MTRQVEAPEFAAFVGRVIRAFARRAADGDLDALVGLVEARDEIDRAITQAGRASHAFGYSYTEIANALGVTRQAARERFTA